nr:MAG TPA: hypothetical protein [Bacteriophage sp.]
MIIIALILTVRGLPRPLIFIWMKMMYYIIYNIIHHPWLKRVIQSRYMN